MTAIKLDTLGGMLPAVDDRLLGEKAASHSENTWMYTGRLSGIPQPVLVKALTAGTAKVFRIPTNYVDVDHLADSTWMEFTNVDTDVVRALVVGDTYDRYYWACSSDVPRYNTAARITAGNTGANAPYKLGIPANVAPALAVVGGVAANETRAYVTTWETTFGEEGPPSLPIVVTGPPDGSWNLTITAAAADDIAGPDRDIAYTNIYRTVTSSSGVATYFYVGQVAVATLAYSDTATDTTVSANSELESTNWTAPPTDLQGWITMPNGIIAGWRENEVWFSEPYRPHAWPSLYTLVVDFPIVGLGVTNQTLVVCTQGYPTTISGIHPASMAQSKSPSLEPCMSRGSIVSTTEGVYYASPNGLVFAGQGIIQNITRKLVTKDKWHTLVNQTTLRAARLGMAYYAFGSMVAGVFDPLSFDPLSYSQENFLGAYGGILIDPNDERVAFNLMSSRDIIANVQNDPWSGEVFIIKSNNLYRINMALDPPIRSVYLWRSKIFQAKKPVNIGAMVVYWEAPSSGAPDAVGTLPALSSTPLEFPELPGGSTYGVVRLYGDGVLRSTNDLTTSGALIRPPSGMKCTYWQVEFETYVDVFSVQMASSVKELRQV